jgi:hypothetical protein
MRLGGPFSLVLHVGIAAAGIAFAPEMMPTTSEPAPYIPIDLVTIADETNLTEVVEATVDEEEAEEVAEEEAAPAPPPPPPPEPEEVALPAETPPPKKAPEPVKKPEAKPAPSEEAFDSALQDILAAANSAPKKAKEPAPAKRTDLTKVGEGAPREGFGNRRENTATIAAFIKQQLRDNGCWGDQDDLAGAQSLRAVIRVKFRRDGTFDGSIDLVEPARQPPQGPFLVYINRAFTALHKCEDIGFKVPAEYFRTQPVQYIDIEFLP